MALNVALHVVSYRSFSCLLCTPLNCVKFLFLLAEAQGFEPWNPCGLLVFKTSAIDHSAKLPKPYLQKNFKATALNHSATLTGQLYRYDSDFTVCGAFL
jgi:hypothetical protein